MKRVAAPTWQAVSGAPISLLNEPGGAMVGGSVALVGAIGQTAVGASSGGGVSLRGGLLAGRSGGRKRIPAYRAPIRAQRFLFAATITGGELGTLEEEGTTDFARWVPMAALADQPLADIVMLALRALGR